MGENVMYNNFGGFNNGGVPYPGMAIDPSMYNNYQLQYGYNPVVPQTFPMPQNLNAATDEEIMQMLNSRPKDVLNINIEPIQNVRAICCHKHKHADKVVPINDGTGDVYCPICQVRWSPENVTEEQLEEAVNIIKNCMQNDKWVGDLPTEFVRQYYPILPFIEMYPRIHKYAMKNFDKLDNARAFTNAANVQSNVLFNNMMTPDYNMYYNQPMGQFNGFAQAPYNPQQMQQMGQFNGFAQAPYNPQQMQQMGQFAGYQPPMGQMASGVNPMQLPYGYNPQAPNQQFANQANMMMGGQPQQGNPYANAGVQQPVVPQPQEQQQTQQTTTETKKYDL